MRLDKFLSKATELSRKESKKILHAGEVTVNDQVIKDPGVHVDVVNDDVIWAGEHYRSLRAVVIFYYISLKALNVH